MTKEKREEFLTLYFSEHTVHDNFTILEKAQLSFKTIPETIDNRIFYNISLALLKNRGIFPNLRFLNKERFSVIKEVFVALAPLAGSFHKARYLAEQKNIAFEEAYKTAAEDFSLENHSAREICILSAADIIFLFSLKSIHDLSAIHEYPETERSFNNFKHAIEALLLEKRYTSVKSFRLIDINSYSANDLIISRALNTTKYLLQYPAGTEEKMLLYMLSIISLGEDPEAVSEVQPSLYKLKKSEPKLYQKIFSGHDLLFKKQTKTASDLFN